MRRGAQPMRRIVRARGTLLAPGTLLIAALVAAACGAPGDGADEARADSLTGDTARAGAAADTAPADRADPTVLLEADRAFARATAERGAGGWVSWFAEDGAILAPGNEIRGHDEIRAVMEPAFAEPGYRLEWEPARAELAASGELGYTIGSYQRTRVVEGDTIIGTGTYLTVWRRQPDGAWRVELDLGVPDPDPPRPPADSIPGTAG